MRFLPMAAMGLPLACTYVQVFEVPKADAGAGAPNDACPGVCEPIVLASGQGDSAGGSYYAQDGGPLDGPDEVATDGAYVYWTNLRGEVMRVPAGGGDVTRVTLVGAPVALAVDGVDVFVSSAETGTIWRAPKEGGPATEITTASPQNDVPMQIALGGDLLFWNSGDGVYACAKADCSAPRTLWSTQTGAVTESTSGLALVNDRVYFGDMQITGPIQGQGNSSGTVNSIGIDGTGNAIVAWGFDDYYLVSTDGEGIYATARSAIVRAPLRGTAAQKILASGDDVDPWRIVAADGYVYWTELFAPGRVMRVTNVGDAAPQAISPPTTGARGIAVSFDAIYWTTGDGRVLKLPKPAPNPPR
jgi:hypothetical protein